MDDLIVAGVGDVGPRRADIGGMFARLGDALEADITFGQLECVLSHKGSPAPNARLAMRSDPAVAGVLVTAGFDVLSLAGNHAMDYGGDALCDTVAHVQAAGLAACGAGANIAEARQAAVLRAKGKRVAFLAYNAILPHGYAAESNRPGCAPLRVHTLYEAVEPDQPGTDPRIITFAAPNDLAAILEDVARARASADHVIVSMHWGIHFVRAVLAQYQRDVGRAIIDAGADAIFGHHPHLLKGIEFHKGRPILHSLGNFAIEQPSAFMDNLANDRGFQEISRLNPDWKPDEKYMNPDETRYTVVARVALADGEPTLTLVPCRIDDDSVPCRLAAGTPEARSLLDYLTAISRESGLDTLYAFDGEGCILARPRILP